MKNLLIAVVAGGALLLNAAPVLATQVVEDPKDACGQQTEYTKSSDYSDFRVSIDFINTQSNGNPDTVTVNAQVANGYKLVSVQLDIENDNQQGYVDKTANFPGVYNPNPGEDIEGAKVTVEKVCGEVCNDPEASNYEELTEGQTTGNKELCVYPQPEEPTATPSATPKTPTPELPKTGIDGSGMMNQLWLSLGIAFLLSSLGTGVWLTLRKRD